MRVLIILLLFLMMPAAFAGKSWNFWGINIQEPHPEIVGCKVKTLEDNKIFSYVKISAFSYTFANDKNTEEEEFTCFYGDEKACFDQATEEVSKKFGQPLKVYALNENNEQSVRAPFFNIWKYDKDDKHIVLLLFGSGQGMTLDVNHYASERQSKSFILSTIRSFHFTAPMDLILYLEK